jgi:hypothetical protein|tara:strand:- start:255 stop:575 length:321 start_codon:yes stop_codon:yes gene_type:complete
MDNNDVVKKKIELEVEVGSTHVERGVNPYQKWIHLAKAIDAWRIFPRIFVIVYIYLMYESVIWFMGIPDPNLEQSALVSVVVGAMGVVFGIYSGKSGQSKTFKGES